MTTTAQDDERNRSMHTRDVVANWIVAGWLTVAVIWVVEMASPSASAAEDTPATKTAQISDGRWATLQALPPSPAGTPGFPDRSPELDVLPKFVNPPEGYGPVPIYLWNGDKLTRERLAWQLDQLKDSGLSGVCVYYSHSHRGIDRELNRNYKGPFGKTEPGDPPVFTDEWWKLWNWFSAECAKRKMAVGFLDYTFSPLNSGYWPDEIGAMPQFKNYRGNLQTRKLADRKTGERFEYGVTPDNTVSLAAYPVISNRIDVSKVVNLLTHAESGKVQWIAPDGGLWRIFESVAVSGDAYGLHPDYGNAWNEHFFQRFVDHTDPAARKGMNYFFQDELHLAKGSWAEDFPERFQQKKGYDIRPWLPALITDVGAMTAKVRLDYSDVLADLSEERFFKPVFDWHWQRGLIYGVDNWGRGANPVAYGDYFRTHRWFTAPGNDAPSRGISFIQTKVSSSIAHLYERPRVWMEAFHSMGWDAYPDLLTTQIDRHYLFGANVLDMASLCYSLYGGWWEWAPPCFHFRMPYWPHFKKLMQYTERLSYLLSQGRHVSDVAIIYPVSPKQVHRTHNPKITFDAATKLFDTGIDFTFMDYQSLARSQIRDGRLLVAGSSYPVLVLADLPSVRFTTLQQAQALFRAGGIVLAVGALPGASDRAGSDDPEVDKIVKELFGLTAADLRAKGATVPQRNAAGGLGLLVGNVNDLPSVVKREISSDFVSPSGQGKALHRRVGFRDVYMVMDAPLGDECFFRAKGKVELWDAWTGSVRELPVLRQTDEGTVVRIPVAPPRSSLIVFSPGNPTIDTEPQAKNKPAEVNTVAMDGIWESELIPTMDNRWGDFEQPPTDELIGAEARELYYTTVENAEAIWPDAKEATCSWPVVQATFGPQMYRVQVAADETDYEALLLAAEKSVSQKGKAVEIGGKQFPWQSYDFSWRWGVLGQPGSQGYHGLKAKVDNGFIILDEGGHQIFRTSITVEKDMDASVVIEGHKPDRILVDRNPLSDSHVRLTRGTHQVLIAYRNVPRINRSRLLDNRPRSAVVFVSGKEQQTTETYPLAMKWYRQPGILPFDIHVGSPSIGQYRFLAAPGLKAMRFAAFGRAEVRVDGRPVKIVADESRRDDGAIEYSVTLDTLSRPQVWVDIRVRHDVGRYGGAAFAGPVKMTTGKGLLATGDWSTMGVLKHYSGGMLYGRDFDLTVGRGKERVELDLGRVIATCEVRINSKSAGVLVNTPFKLDVSEYVRPGRNRIEVLVYNTLANHYQSIPSNYRGKPVSGLIGPVRMTVTRQSGTTATQTPH